MKNETKKVGKNSSSSKSVQPRSNLKSSQKMRIHKTSENERASIRFIKKIPKGKKSQFDLLQFVRYSPLFKQELDELGITKNTIKPAAVESNVEAVDNKNNEEEKHSSTEDSDSITESESINLSEDIPDLASEDESEDETEDDDINVGGNEPPSAFFGFWFKVLPL